MNYYTIAHDGEIGYFATYRTKEGAEQEAAKWRAHYPQHTYEVVEEHSAQARYAQKTNSAL